MDEGIRNAIGAGAPPADALAAASRVPARLLGDADRGSLAPGSRADLVVLDAELRVSATWVGGAAAWER